jgi:hypothetical protein
MQTSSRKIPGYALASTFVALGGILNGYVVIAVNSFHVLSHAET